MTESPQKYRIHSVFSTSRRKFVIDFRPAEIGVERERDCDVDVAYRFVHGKVNSVCRTHSINFKTNIDRPAW
jgi:hypothetical protein